MTIAKGLCRLKLKSGLIVFGEIKEVKDDVVIFHSFSPSAMGKKIPINNILETESCAEEDIPPYE